MWNPCEKELLLFSYKLLILFHIKKNTSIRIKVSPHPVRSFLDILILLNVFFIVPIFPQISPYIFYLLLSKNRA